MGDLSRRRTLHSTSAKGHSLGIFVQLRSGAAVIVLVDGGEPEPGYVDAAAPVDVVLVEADVDSLLDSSGVPVLVLVYRLHAIPVGVVTSSPGVFSYC